MRSSPTLSWIVCERTGHWAAALRRDLDAAVDSVREIRHPTEISAAIDATPVATIVAVELRREGLDLLLDALVTAEQRGTHVLPIAFVAAEMADAAALAREAGALHVVTSPRRMKELVDLGRRHQARVPAPVQTLRERVWAGLPWSAVAPTP